MSLLLAQLIRTGAKTANAAAHGLHHKQLLNPPKGGKRRKSGDKPGCTPCEAMARVDAAKRMTQGG